MKLIDCKLYHIYIYIYIRSCASVIKSIQGASCLEFRDLKSKEDAGGRMNRQYTIYTLRLQSYRLWDAGSMTKNRKYSLMPKET